jgi:hypothetical protein
MHLEGPLVWTIRASVSTEGAELPAGQIYPCATQRRTKCANYGAECTTRMALAHLQIKVAAKEIMTRLKDIKLAVPLEEVG